MQHRRVALDIHPFQIEFFREAGFGGVEHERIADPSPTPDVYTGRWFRDTAQLRAFKAEGALVVHGKKE